MKWTRDNAGRSVLQYYLYCFLSNLDFARGIFVLYLVDKGLSLSQVGVLQTVLFWSNLGTEVPAGIWADKFKRKYSVALGLACIGLAAVLMIFSTSVWMFAAAFLLHGVGFAFQSGADNALLFDGLRQAGAPWSEGYVKILGRSRGIGSAAMGLAMCAGGLLFRSHAALLYAIFAAAMLLAALAVLALPEARDSRASEAPAEEVPSILENLTAFFKLKSGRSVFWFILGMGFLEASHAPLFIYGQVLFKDYQVAPAGIAAIMAAAMGFNAAGFLLAERLERFSVRSLVMAISFATALLTFGYLARPPLAVAVALFILVDVLPGVLFVHTDGFINGRVPSEIRATILSVHSFLSSIAVSAAFLGVGALLERFPSFIVLGTLGVLPLLGIAALSVYFNAFAVETASEAQSC
jgi:hypothetical protein